ncbi:MAG: aldose 1-epimerase [Bryobacterales bacterium]|nr:aldose 1-epimerase [Bryobacterales bacterium]
MCAASSGTYTAVPAVANGIDIVRLSGPDDVVVSVAPKIGNNAYEFIVNGKNAFWFPFDSVAEFAAAPELCGNPLLAPWANRLDEHAFYACGVRYELNRGIGNYLTDPAGQPIHGLLLYSSLWEVVELGSEPDSAWVTSRLEFSRFPALMAQFPFAHSIAVTYTLAGTGLEVRTEIKNQGAEPMPVSVGFHPYFQLHDSPRDDWRVHLAAASIWELNERFTPTGVTSPATDTFPDADDLSLRGEFLDHVFGDLRADSDGWARFSARGAEQSLMVAYGDGYPVAVVYAPSGEGQQFLCFEPMSGITNAFNLAHRGQYAQLPVVQPGEVWTGRYRISAQGF